MVCSAGNPALVAAPTREWAEKQAYRDRFSNLKNESRILRGLLSFGEGRLGSSPSRRLGRSSSD